MRAVVLGLSVWVGCAGEIGSGDGQDELEGLDPVAESPAPEIEEGGDADSAEAELWWRRRDAGTPKPADASTPRDASVSPTPADAAVVDAGIAPPPSTPDANVPAPSTDKFGVRMLYPTTSNGRVWTLPDNAETPTNEWNVERNLITRVSPGVFHTLGNNGEVRMSIASPAGRAWWRNVEMTGYFRYTAPHDSNDQLRHWELIARGERHGRGSVSASSINGGVAAPAGTATWPGYPFGGGSVTANCLGSSYHGNFYVEGRGLFEKEITHTEGYASQRGAATASGFSNPQNRWFGLKYVVRNADANRRVHMELWLDANANGDWKMLSQYDDVAGGWVKTAGQMDGCTTPPFSFTRDQLLTWAGPWVVFRSDSVEMDFRSLSVREIAALP